MIDSNKNPFDGARPSGQSAPWPKIQRISAFLFRHRFLVAYFLALASMLPLWSAVGRWAQGDVIHYRNVSAEMLRGKLPYRDTVVEYPPYAIPFFLLPRAFGGDAQYAMIFTLTALIGDWAIKLVLIGVGFQNSKNLRCFLPLLIYASAVPAIHYFYLQRYDIWPALICIGAIWLFVINRYALSGLSIAIGIGVKLYPAVFVPPLFILAMRRRRERAFCAGLFVGLLPIMLLSFSLPWWHFAEFQGSRGLQVESIYASLLWLGKLFHFIELRWASATAWFEVKGPAVTFCLPWARAFFAGAVIGSTAFASWAAVRSDLILLEAGKERTTVSCISLLARLLLVPLLAFVAFNQVLSPQYMIWLLPLAAMGSLEGNLWPVIMISLATWLTPVFFPSSDYHSGLNMVQTLVLLLRNIVLITVWLLLIAETFKNAASWKSQFQRSASWNSI